MPARTRRALASFLSLSALCAAPALAAEPKADLEPMMTVRGKQVLSEDFSAPALDAKWATAKGEWAVKDGALVGTEKPADMHAAVIRTPAAVTDAVYQFDFRFDGAKQMHLSLNGAKGHVCRVTITPAGFQVRKDGAKNDEADKGVLLDSCKQAFEPGKWYTMCVEVCGKEMLARVDDRHFAFGADDKVASKKANLAFPVSGATAAVANVKVWEATPSPAWAATKAKLAAEHPVRLAAAGRPGVAGKAKAKGEPKPEAK